MGKKQVGVCLFLFCCLGYCIVLLCDGILFCSFMMVGDLFFGKIKVLEVLVEILNVLMDKGYDDENVNKVIDQVFFYLKNLML